MKVCDVLEHMEAVGDQRKRANSISCGNETEFGTGEKLPHTDDDFYEEEDNVYDKQERYPG